MTNKVFIATSLDGYIADKDNKIDWLHQLPNPNGDDFGFDAFIAGIDALLMGRNTFEMVLSFGVEWPYNKPVFVLSNSLTHVPNGYEGKVFLVNGELQKIVKNLTELGYHNLYIDGGKTIQSFLKEDLVDEMILTRIPVLLGGGYPLFGDLPEPLGFKLLASKKYIDKVVQNHYIRDR
ncbi:Dihydrofolate reductase [Pseudoalteromonas sp. P1-9]|uniref:dihydrofolate reductase family protein n=1 Tax=Pseudoalteromonas sp. P1-9 TaxID=1710354 RepID=UPI0006D6233E|nr:dihydrofolate reductase family protein [Pseudoalteromonas sp. P1-9]KPV98325.1 Dihydrofolate reductase [Pseudoalteromonas sp. P1-9]